VKDRITWLIAIETTKLSQGAGSRCGIQCTCSERI